MGRDDYILEAPSFAARAPHRCPGPRRVQNWERGTRVRGKKSMMGQQAARTGICFLSDGREVHI
jgi:hypothetical protein